MRGALSAISKCFWRRAESHVIARSGTSRALASSNSAQARRYDRSAFGQGSETVLGSGKDLANFFYRRAAIFGFAGAVLYFTNQETVPVTNRRRLILFPASWERTLGDVAVRQVVGNEAVVCPEDHPSTRLVKSVVASLAEQVHNLESIPVHLRNIEWTVTVVESRTVNAMAAPGGRIIVYTGIMDLLTRKEELAAVIAHEMGHVLARHSAESITKAAVTLPLRIGAALMLESGTGMFDAMHTVLVALPASRAAESEADTIGMALAARACFKPSGMIRMLSKLDQLEKRSAAEKKPAFMRTHPLTSERIEAARRKMADAERLMQESGCGQFANFFDMTFTGSTDGTVFNMKDSIR